MLIIKFKKGHEIKPEQAAQLAVFAAMMANVAMTAYISQKQGIGSKKLALESEVFYLSLVTIPLFRAGHINLAHSLFHEVTDSADPLLVRWNQHIEARIAEKIATQGDDSSPQSKDKAT